MKRLPEISIPYVLAVDDEPMNLFLLEDIIEDRYELKIVNSGQACLDAVKERAPDLILLDINMPGLSGFDVCKALKQEPETNAIPVIFLTAMLGSDDERKGLDIGAVDYITKPFTESILLARMKTHLTLRATHSLLEQSNNLLKQERDYIEQIIGSMRCDSRFENHQLKQLLSPVEKSSGDITLSAIDANEQHHVMVGDFTGHGLTAAIAGPLVTSLFYSLVEIEQSAKEIIGLINSELYDKLPTQNFLTATYVVWDKPKQKILISNFAMPPALLIKKSGEVIEIASKSLPLGVLGREVDAIQQVYDFAEGDKLYIFSDGLTEINRSGEDMGVWKQLKQRFKQIHQHGLELDVLAVDIAELGKHTTIEDDITVIELSA